MSGKQAALFVRIEVCIASYSYIAIYVNMHPSFSQYMYLIAKYIEIFLDIKTKIYVYIYMDILDLYTWI